MNIFGFKKDDIEIRLEKLEREVKYARREKDIRAFEKRLKALILHQVKTQGAKTDEEVADAVIDNMQALGLTTRFLDRNE